MRAKTMGWIVGVLASTGVLWGPAVALAYCPGWDKSLPDYDPNYYSVPQEFNRSDHVVEVRVLRETWLGEDGKPKRLEPPFQNGAKKPWGFDPYVGAYYDVEVLKSFKGKAPKNMRLFSENSTARFWFDVGSEQVLFVSKGTFDPPIGRRLSVDTCGNSQSLAKAAGLLGKLNRLSALRPH
jgi:hypothetical protein